jgi:hypothetical protein
MPRDLDQLLADLFRRVDDLRWADLTRSASPQGDRLEFGWTVVLHVPRMGKRGQKVGRGLDEKLSGMGETPEEAAEKAVQFYEWRRAGLV